ncbi:MAG: amidohydrolase family protein [Acidimicrobiaceae bacterium]|nr:amidohydrolase family protein [Acidimicrobiaceae bacterium]
MTIGVPEKNGDGPAMSDGDAPLRLVGAVAPDGAPIGVECVGGRIAAVWRDREAPPRGARTLVVDLAGHVLMPALAEPHAHVDKAYTADDHANPTGDLDGALKVSMLAFAESTAEDIERRARRAFAAYVAKGCLAVRTHVSVGPFVGLRSIEGVVRAAKDFEALVDIQIVAHGSPPTYGAPGADQAALLRDAFALGATHLGGTPYRAEDPAAETAALLDLAGELGKPVDFHTDETIDPAVVSVRDLGRLVARTGFPHPVAASHCVSLGVIPPAEQEEVAALLAESGVAVISLPQTNLYLQSREVRHGKPRGLTALDALYSAGVMVAAGGDNLQDPFNPLGKADPLEAASLLVTAGHLDVLSAFNAVSRSARLVMGVAAGGLVEGAPADLVATPGGSLREAIAESDTCRVVVRRGALVTRAVLDECAGGRLPKEVELA